MCESRVGGTCEDKGGGPDNCIGETSNFGRSHQRMTDQDGLFDVKVDDFSEVSDCSNETVGLTNIEIDVDGEAEAEGEVERESDNDSSSDTKGLDFIFAHRNGYGSKDDEIRIIG
ncbi:hypothetical protein V6N13_115948 [Hibiscus sabdariffa]|uniref:Uncharacterized protein n=1 Tax=Hibiscus sabdariffa TaxID=183260 RepID=A0ABR2QS96_9ROSI